MFRRNIWQKLLPTDNSRRPARNPSEAPALRSRLATPRGAMFPAYYREALAGNVPDEDEVRGGERLLVKTVPPVKVGIGLGPIAGK